MNARHDSYFYFTKKERNAFLVLITLVAVIIICSRVVFYYQSKRAFSNLTFPEIKSWVEAPREKYPSRFENKSAPEKDVQEPATLFYFDPNSKDELSMQKLGFSKKLISTIINYRNKGGKFREANDLDKIWGMPASFAGELKPYVRIKEHKREYEDKGSGQVLQKKIKVVDINSADSLALLELPGIGPVLSSRIIRFRERLGGFISIDQVGETFGLPDSSFKKIKPLLKLSSTDIKKIDLNLAGLEDLKKHPYIRYNLAKLIISYRQQHGPFHQVSDLKAIMVLDDSSFQRIQPYVIVK